MEYANLRDQTIEEVLNQVQALQAMASEGQVRSVAAIAARCAVEVGDRLGELSTNLDDAQRTFGEGLSAFGAQLQEAREEIRASSAESSIQAAALVGWTRVLVWVTGAYAGLTGLLVLVTVLK